MCFLNAQGDVNNRLIRRIVVSSVTVTTLAGVAGINGFTDGIGTLAKFNTITGVALDAAGAVALGVSYWASDNVTCAQAFVKICSRAIFCFICVQADAYNHCIRRIDMLSSTVTTLAGVALLDGSTDGIGSAARFTNPWGVAMDHAGAVAIIVSASRGGYLRNSCVV